MTIGVRDTVADESTVARIRDAAIVRFGPDGFGVGLRAIAADAGVTAGLVVQRFGSKDGLRQACDAHVLAIMRDEKTKALVHGSGATILMQMAQVEQFAPVVRYLLRSVQVGGDLAAMLIEQMIADAQEYLAAGEAAGVVLPSRRAGRSASRGCARRGRPDRRRLECSCLLDARRPRRQPGMHLRVARRFRSAYLDES